MGVACNMQDFKQNFNIVCRGMLVEIKTGQTQNLSLREHSCNCFSRKCLHIDMKGFKVDCFIFTSRVNRDEIVTLSFGLDPFLVYIDLVTK